MTIYGRSVELVSRCIECNLAEPESLASLGGSAPGLVDGILSHMSPESKTINQGLDLDPGGDWLGMSHHCPTRIAMNTAHWC